MKRRIALFMLTVLVAGCKLGPNYQRPQVDVPGGYRGAPALETAQPEHDSSRPVQQSAQQASQPAGDSQQKTRSGGYPIHQQLRALNFRLALRND
ncbi:MAG: hypothetical protein WB679_15240 [Terracidiphilus sp.]